MIKQMSFKHGWFYHYRVCEKKTDELCKNHFSSLKDYLFKMFNECPNDYFSKGPRSSSLKMELFADLNEQKLHNLCLLTNEALIWKNYKTAHSNVEVFMLNYDKNTIAVEIPIWLMPDEHDMFFSLFNENYPLTGHIDILQVINDKIWILDFKPKAHLEKYATTQTYFYAYMLSKRTGIPLSNFMCGYFDENTTFTFNPNDAKIAMPAIIFEK